MQPNKGNGFDSRSSSPTEPHSLDLTREDVLDCDALSRMAEPVPVRKGRSVLPLRQSTPGSSPSASTLVSEEPVQFIRLGRKADQSAHKNALAPISAAFGLIRYDSAEEVDVTAPVPLLSQRAVAETSIPQIDGNYTFLRPLESFITAANTAANEHPYTKLALGTLTSAAQSIITQINTDKFVRVPDLLPKIGRVYGFLLEDGTLNNMDATRDILAQFARVISACAQFTKSYAETQNLWSRRGKDVMAETQTAVGSYCKALDDLMQQYRDRSTEEPNVNVYRVLDDMNVDSGPYAGGAGLNTTKRCLDGTRREVLSDIVNWISASDPNVSRIFWLHGPAGKGKSAIAHTIASWSETVGILGSCFCFDWNRVAEHLEDKMMTTIARDMADRYPTWRQALADAIEKDQSLKTSPDLIRQWDNLILGPLSRVTNGIVGKVVVVIDGLDKCGPASVRSQILSVLTSAKTVNLPSNFRFLVTSQPSHDIQLALNKLPHVTSVSLDDIPAAVTERDIHLFISKEVGHLEGIEETEINRMVRDANGLFEWARLACTSIKTYRAGETAKERFNDLDEQGPTLLDEMYRTNLDAIIAKSSESLVLFRSVLHMVLSAKEPLLWDAVEARFLHKPNHRNTLMSMAPFLSGGTSPSAPVRPLHPSFYDFLHGSSRSGEYFVNFDDIPDDIDDHSSEKSSEEFLDSPAVPEEVSPDLSDDELFPGISSFNPTTPSLPEPKLPDRQHFLGRLKRGVIAQRPESRLPTSQTTSGKHSAFFRLSQRGERKDPDVDEHSRMEEDDAACARLKSVLAVAKNESPPEQKRLTFQMSADNGLVPRGSPVESPIGNSNTPTSTNSPSGTRSDSSPVEANSWCCIMLPWWKPKRENTQV